MLLLRLDWGYQCSVMKKDSKTLTSLISQEHQLLQFQDNYSTNITKRCLTKLLVVFLRSIQQVNFKKSPFHSSDKYWMSFCHNPSYVGLASFFTGISVIWVCRKKWKYVFLKWLQIMTFTPPVGNRVLLRAWHNSAPTCLYDYLRK